MSTAAKFAFRRGLRRMVPKLLRAVYFEGVNTYNRYQLTHGYRHEPDVCRVLRSHIKPGWTCLDVGANRGIMTVLMAQQVGPSGKVLAFEPHPENVVRIESNVQLCRVQDRVKCYQKAVNDGACNEIQLYAGRRHSSSEWNTVGIDADGKPAEAIMMVSAVSLDAAIPSHQRVDLVKIDVEGAEFQVLAGMKNLLNRWSPVLVIECHSEENWKACAALIQQGYELFDMHNHMLNPARSSSSQSAHILAIKSARSHSLAA